MNLKHWIVIFLILLHFEWSVATFQPGGPKSFDCPMRQLAIEYAQYIQPSIKQNQLQDILDALNGSIEAKNCTLNIINHNNFNNNNNIKLNKNIPTIIVDINSGIDDYLISSTFKTIEYALNYAKMKYGSHRLKQILLKKGTYYLSNTIAFSQNDNNLIIKNYNNEQVIISGGMQLNCSWKLYKLDRVNGLNYYQCNLNNSNNNISSNGFSGLRINGRRGIRARYPNSNPEIDGFGSTLRPISYLDSLPPHQPQYEYKLNSSQTYIRNDTKYNWFSQYTVGINGVCDNFSPSIGYWCSLPQDIDHGHHTYSKISGLVYNSSILPNTPYKTDVRNSGIVNVWRAGHWETWMFEINDTINNIPNTTIIFGIGGFQGARGGPGAEFFIENVYEELDFPTEWFYNKTTKILYYRNNITNQSPNNLLFEVTNLKVLMNFTGKDINNTVSNITISGITFKDAAITYFDPHGMPSGGDWSLEREGALYFEYTQNININNNYFSRLDGNVISINRYNRNFTIYENEFIWIGNTIISSWGDTMNATTNTSTYGMGIDGTTGNQPRGLNISYNIAHEFGIFEKQSAFFFNAKSCNHYIHNNIIYNIPRAGILFNDGFGGNSNIYNNLLYNTCRESGAHGPFNSWDRQPFLTYNDNNIKTTIKKYDSIYKNFIVSNYESNYGIDNDDGSCYYNSSYNFLVYGDIGLKGETVAHDNHHYNNIYAYINQYCFDNTAQFGGTIKNHINWYFNNICVLNVDPPNNNYGYLNCSEPQNVWPLLYNNTIYTLNETNVDELGLCDLTEKEFQSKYNTDLNTNILTNLNDTWLIQQAKNMLFS